MNKCHSYWKPWEVGEATIHLAIDVSRLEETVAQRYTRRCRKLIQQADYKGLNHLSANSDLQAIVKRIAA